MPVRKLDVPFIKNVSFPAERQVFYFDELLPRFLLSVYPSGRKTFFIKYQNKYNKPRWHKIGNFPIMILDEARKKATKLLSEIDNVGSDPAKQKKKDKDAMTVAELCDWYLVGGVQGKKPSTVADYCSIINRHIKPLIGDVPLEALTRGQVIDMMNDIINGDKVRGKFKSNKLRGLGRVTGGDAVAVKSIAVLGAILEFAKGYEKITDNPAHSIKGKPKIYKRDAFLNLTEVETLGSILNAPELQPLYATEFDVVKLLLLTGCRKDEILTLKWDYVDFENRAFRFPDTKTGRQVRPFGKGATNMLRKLEQNKSGDYVFPSKTGKGGLVNILRTFNRICELTDKNDNRVFDRDDINLHTMRHSFASIANGLGHMEAWVAPILGHSSGTITGRYTHAIPEVITKVADDTSLAIESALERGGERKITFKVPKYKKAVK